MNKLVELHLPFKTVLLNKCTPDYTFEINSQVPGALHQKLDQLVFQHQRHLDHETKLIQSTLGTLPKGASIHKIPIFPQDVYNLDALVALNKTLA